VRGVRERVDRGRRRCIVRNMVVGVHLLGVVGCVCVAVAVRSSSAKAYDGSRQLKFDSVSRFSPVTSPTLWRGLAWTRRA
jgi:hypothetical protein